MRHSSPIGACDDLRIIPRGKGGEVSFLSRLSAKQQVSHHRMILQAVFNAIYIYLYTESMTENSGSLAVQLAEATISEAQCADRWQVG